MNEKIESLVKQPWFVPTVIGVLSFGGGLGAGYILGKRKNENVDVHEDPKQLHLDFSGVKDGAGIVLDEPEAVEVVRPPRVVITEEVALSKDILKVKDLSQLRPSMVQPDEDEEADDQNDEEDDEQDEEVDRDTYITITPETTGEDWDYEKEVLSRSPTAPYILHQEEFYADEKNYSQMSLTFYAVDEILADEDSKPIYNHSSVTGPLRFGHGSGDPNVVYIRNDERRAEYEIVRVDGLYSLEVLGLEIENNERVSDLKHSKITKFRMD